MLLVFHLVRLATDSLDDRNSQFEQIYADEFGYVWNSLRRLGIPERNLEDVCHEVFMVVYRKLEQYDSDRPIRPWLFGIAFRVASDHREKASNARELLTDPEPPSEAPAALDELSADEARDVVMRAVQQLDMERRAIFVLSELDGHAMPEVAESLSVPLNTAYSRLQAARETFETVVRDMLEHELAEGVTP